MLNKIEYGDKLEQKLNDVWQNKYIIAGYSKMWTTTVERNLSAKIEKKTYHQLTDFLTTYCNSGIVN